jgi:glycosyltransferase involved in cell wall biosynthesis
VVVVHLSQGGSFIREGLLLWLARLRGSGTVAHLHGSRFVPFSQRRPRLVRAVLSQARKIIVLSEATQQALARLVEPKRVCLVPNAVPGGGQREKEALVVFGGAVTERKGVDVLMAAWRSSCTGKGWRLVIAGPVLDEHVVDRSMPDAQFVGALSHPALMALLDRSAIAVLPSRDEAMPMFILEAMARHNCVVSTRVGGIAAVLDQGCGVLTEPGNAAELAAALEEMIRDEPTRLGIAQRGHRRFGADFSAQAIYPRVEQLWLSSLDRSH